jgi:[phosphatase 2A protein]-leucine-carboxy methyltransferase
LESQVTRLKDCGFSTGQEAIDINYAHDKWVGQEELNRIAQLEMLDEMEEWRLLAGHYCIAWAWLDSQSEKASPFKTWGSMKID